MAGRIILETERLWLREMDFDDLVAYFRLGSDPDIIRYVGHTPLRNLDEARQSMIERPLADYAKYGYGRWACELKATKEVIGFAGLKYLPEQDEVDLGYRFIPEYWGQGFATESSRPIVQFGFEQLQLTRMIGLVDPANRASIRVLAKLGFTQMADVVYMGELCHKFELLANASPCV